MDMPVKDSPGLCRCCFSEGCYKDLSTAYAWMGDTEIYADMLLECFDISITQHVDGPNGPNRLICEVCITRLRDASNFKKQVLNCEKKFIDMVAKGAFKASTSEFNVQVSVEKEPKLEPILEEDIETPNLDYLDVLDYDDDFDPKGEASTSHQSDDNEPLAKLTTRKRKLKPKKETATKAAKGKAPKVVKKEEKPKATKKERSHTESEGSRSFRRKTNMVTIINNTTLIPFKWRSTYRCFFCNKMISDRDALKKHSKAHGTLTTDHKTLYEYKKPDMELKFDSSEINCELCYQEFTSYHDIVDHLTTKHNVAFFKDVTMTIATYRLKDLKCEICSEEFTKFRTLGDHMNKSHPLENLPCEYCGQMFSKKKILEAHKRNHHRDGGFRCKLCNVECRTNLTLKGHYKREHHISACDVCHMDFPNPELRDEHMADVHSLAREDPKLQDIRELRQRKNKAKQIRLNLSLLLNMTTVIPFRYFAGGFRCFYCRASFNNCEDLRAHTVCTHPVYNDQQRVTKKVKGIDMSIRIDVSIMHCKECLRDFSDFQELVNHLVDDHNAKYDISLNDSFDLFKFNDENLTCVVCGISGFDHVATLLKHVNEEHHKKKLICPHCGRIGFNSGWLSVHIRRMHREDLVTCTACNISFATADKLEYHKAKVHNVKAFKCKHCSEKFPTHYHRYLHLVEAHKIGSKCMYCDKLFIKNSKMLSHVRRIHLKERTVPCTICGMKFFDNILLRLHMVKHTGEKNFHCDFCGKSFYWKKNLKGHIKSHHKNSQLELENAQKREY